MEIISKRCDMKNVDLSVCRSCPHYQDCVHDGKFVNVAFLVPEQSSSAVINTDAGHNESAISIGEQIHKAVLNLMNGRLSGGKR